MEIQSHIYSCIHYSIYMQGCRGWSLLQHTVGENTPWTVRQFISTQTDRQPLTPTGNLESLIYLTCMPSDYKEKTEHKEDMQSSQVNFVCIAQYHK